jgi:hypothetical protein
MTPVGSNLVRKLFLIVGATMMLAACQQGQTGGGLGSLFGGSSTASGNSSAEGCGSGQSADFLHQNRPGGSDYSAVRCGFKGY